EAMSGVKGENSIKLFGRDLAQLESTALQIEREVKPIAGVKDLGVLKLLGQPNLLIEVDRNACARYGVLVSDVNAVVQSAIGGQAVTQVLEGEQRFGLVVGFLPQYRQDVEAISNIQVATPDGARIPLKQLAKISDQTGSFKDALFLLATVPCALVGGILSLVLTRTHFSISAAVGIISLVGVAILGGVLLISRINDLRQEGVPLDDAIRRSAESQMRPILMATLGAAIGLLPAAISTGIGAQAQQPLARVVVGGMMTAAVLILVVLPVLYRLVNKERSIPEPKPQAHSL